MASTNKGNSAPSIPGFNLNTNTDTLLKRDADKYRGKAPHPVMVNAGFENIRPYDHEDLDQWALSTHFGTNDSYFNTVH